MNSIEIKNLSKEYWKSFGKVQILKNITLEIEEGEVVGFLGANGAGKTTSLKILAGLIQPTQGEVKIFGEYAATPAARHSMSFLPEHPFFPENSTGQEVIKFCGALINQKVKGLEVIQILARVGLSDMAHQKVDQFSKGMRQRLAIAQSLIGNPRLLLLDEPMSGLDPVARQQTMELLQKLKRQGKTIVFSTHILSDAQLICDRIAFLENGELHFRSPVENSDLTPTVARTLHVRGLSESALQELRVMVDLKTNPVSEGICQIDLKSNESLWRVLTLAKQEKAQLMSLSLKE